MFAVWPLFQKGAFQSTFDISVNENFDKNFIIDLTLVIIGTVPVSP